MPNSGGYSVPCFYRLFSFWSQVALLFHWLQQMHCSSIYVSRFRHKDGAALTIRKHQAPGEKKHLAPARCLVFL